MPGRNVRAKLDLESPAHRALPPPEPGAVTFDVVTMPALVEADWRSLAALPRNSLHQSFDWACAWWRARRLAPLILRGRQAGRTVMLLPLEIIHRRGLRVAGLPGERFNNLNTGLFSDDFPEPDEEQLNDLLAGLRRVLAGYADILLLDTLPASLAGSPHPLRRLMAIEHPDRSLQLPLLSTMDETVNQLNAKTRRKRFRQQCRRLEALGGFDHYCPENRRGQHELLDLFFRQKSERLAALGLPDVFRPADVRRFFHDLADRSEAGPDFPLRLHALRLRGRYEGRIVAVGGLSRKGGHVLCQFGSIDDRLCPDASPGELLFWLMIEQSCREGATVFDFGLGDQPYKRSWCTQETTTYDILLPLSRKGALAQPVLASAMRLKKAIKNNAMLYSLVQRLRAAAPL
ncbi:GNAT family N-acetyltransferase [Pseudorhizobium endolithicum]|uniref:GNAT family N-acetyltransferase n=1 Tax=Pseudorhizobium endolithicum TaxID=1191678 RepID=A0ABM8PJA0_9HYPH|nr:GNAT family N-acetyltransferase [Pseudorhizobium endolithicum]